MDENLQQILYPLHPQGPEYRPSNSAQIVQGTQVDSWGQVRLRMKLGFIKIPLL